MRDTADKKAFLVAHCVVSCVIEARNDQGSGLSGLLFDANNGMPALALHRCLRLLRRRTRASGESLVLHAPQNVPRNNRRSNAESLAAKRGQGLIGRLGTSDIGTSLSKGWSAR